MNKVEHITDYLCTLMTAEVELTGTHRTEIRFNGMSSPGTYRTVLLKKEILATNVLCHVMIAAVTSKKIYTLVQQHLLDMKDLVILSNKHYTHRHLSVTRDGQPVPVEQLDTDTRSRIDEFLSLTREAHLRLYGWVNGLPPVPPSPLCLNITEAETAEMLSFLFDTGIATCADGEWLKKDYIHYFCRSWNLPVCKDYATLMSHARKRPNPTTFLDRLKQTYLDTLELRERQQK